MRKINNNSNTHYRTRLICRVQQVLPSAFCRALGKDNLCREPDTRQTLAVGKKFPLPSAGRSAKIGRRQKNLCRVPDTRQNLAVGKGGRRDGGHLPSAFAECPDVRLSAKGFLFFLKKILCRVPCDLALGKCFFAECQGWHSAN